MPEAGHAVNRNEPFRPINIFVVAPIQTQRFWPSPRTKIWCFAFDQGIANFISATAKASGFVADKGP